MLFRHTPYDGSKQPFTIGLEKLGAADWIDVDKYLVRDLDEKDGYIANQRNAVVRDAGGTQAAQAEALAMLADHLPKRFPDVYVKTHDGMLIIPARRAISFAQIEEPPLVSAARLVQEDLCLMRRGETGWRLAAAVLCFPSGWSLAEKIGGDLGAIHAPVPGFAGRMENVVTRIFDNLRAGAPLVRLNWSIYDDGKLRHPANDAAMRFGDEDDAEARVHIRVERQILTRLPVSGDILFTIRIHLNGRP